MNGFIFSLNQFIKWIKFRINFREVKFSIRSLNWKRSFDLGVDKKYVTNIFEIWYSAYVNDIFKLKTKVYKISKDVKKIFTKKKQSLINV